MEKTMAYGKKWQTMAEAVVLFFFFFLRCYGFIVFVDVFCAAWGVVNVVFVSFLMLLFMFFVFVVSVSLCLLKVFDGVLAFCVGQNLNFRPLCFVLMLF